MQLEWPFSRARRRPSLGRQSRACFEMDGTYSAWKLSQGPIALRGGTFPVRELFRQQAERTNWLAEQLGDLCTRRWGTGTGARRARTRGDRLTRLVRCLKSDVVSELEAVSRAAKWDWACATGRAVISLQHDGVVIVPLPRDHGNEEELRRDLQRVSSAALGYDQPVEIKPICSSVQARRLF